MPVMVAFLAMAVPFWEMVRISSKDLGAEALMAALAKIRWY
jgi:hypothetical protein